MIKETKLERFPRNILYILLFLLCLRKNYVNVEKESR